MSPLKATLKRGALIAAANWQVTLIQSVADSIFKLLIVVPAIGGVFFVALVIGAEPTGLLALEWREMVTTVAAALLSQPLVLAAFLLSLSVVVVGGSLFMFLVKAGTIATLVAGDRHAGAIEQPPLHLDAVARGCGYSAEGFIAGCERMFPRYARLGFILVGTYLGSVLAFLAAVRTTRAWGEGWGGAAVLTVAFVGWITAVNLLYLLLQIVIVADDCTVTSAIRRMAAFLRADLRGVASVFGVTLALAVLATGVSIIAMGALGLIAFVPFFGLAVFPLQLIAWLFRSVVFQYIGLSSVAAYLKLYRSTTEGTARFTTDDSRPASAERFALDPPAGQLR